MWSVARSLSGGDQSFTALGNDNIGVIDIDGEITSADTTVDQLRKFAQDDDIKAIVLHIDSPGGGAAASQEIYHEVLSIREQKKKPVVASIESVGASGAYYIASATNKIYANNASVVGSIGVIMEWTNYGDLLSWAKLKPEVIHAGALKDAGDPTHAITPEERVYFQGLVDNMYGQFIARRGERPEPSRRSDQGARHRAGLDRRAGAAAASDRCPGRIPHCAAGHGQAGGHLRRAQRGEAGRASPLGVGSDRQYGRHGAPAAANAGAASWLLFPVALGPPIRWGRQALG